MEALATKIRTADAPGGDRQLFGRQVCRGKGEHRVHGTLSEMGMVVVSSTLAVGPIANTLTPTVNRSVHPAKHSTAHRTPNSLSRCLGVLRRNDRSERLPRLYHAVINNAD